MTIFHDDVLTEILLRLPAKSLIRFKVVCKNWLSLISSHEFSHLHTVNHLFSKSEPSFLLRHSNYQSQHFYLQPSLKDAKLVPYEFPSTIYNPKIRSVSNGLFLLVENGCEKHCFVYNPTTRQSRKILINSNERYTRVLGLNIAYDPSKSPHYKIICIRAVNWRSSSRLWICDKTKSCKIEVYDSSTNTWGSCGNPFSADRSADFNFGLYWNNGIHWDEEIFNLDDEYFADYPAVMEPFPLEDIDGKEIFQEYYIMSKNHLHYIVHFPKKEWIMVFELLEDYSWSIKYDINLILDLRVASFLNFIRGDSEEEDTMLLIHPSGKIMSYRFANYSSKVVTDFKEEKFFKENSRQFVSKFTLEFTGTLVPLD